MKQRTIRWQSRLDHDEPALIHLVRSVSNNDFDGTQYATYCGLCLLGHGEKWAAPQYDFVSCVRCLGTSKTCVRCSVPLGRTQRSSDVPELCEACVAWADVAGLRRPGTL